VAASEIKDTKWRQVSKNEMRNWQRATHISHFWPK